MSNLPTSAGLVSAKTALITGITGQDGSYLAELLLEKGYAVHGIKRRASSFNTTRIDHLYEDPHELDPRLVLHYGDLTDSTNLIRIIQQVQPDEIYNLGAQSHVAVSFESPEYTANSDALGTLRILEAVRILGLTQKTRIYQASTSELYGLVQEIPQKESTPFYPRSPYGVAKLYAYWITVNYRESYGMYACNGVLFNHESPRRGETFVTRKITRGLARVDAGLEDCLYMGNLDSLRDWGHARDKSSAGDSTRSVHISVQSVQNWKTGGGMTWSASASRRLRRNDALGLQLPAKADPCNALTSCSCFSAHACQWPKAH